MVNAFVSKSQHGVECMSNWIFSIEDVDVDVDFRLKMEITFSCIRLYDFNLLKLRSKIK